MLSAATTHSVRILRPHPGNLAQARYNDTNMTPLAVDVPLQSFVKIGPLEIQKLHPGDQQFPVTAVPGGPSPPPPASGVCAPRPTHAPIQPTK